ncbi:MAG: putative glycosyltransferase, exosortase G system-associated [Peptococcaceae bacterium]|nr:putative glycosyltransferase, exosortase G system-associated [Peptococcaceae bacterium]
MLELFLDRTFNFFLFWGIWLLAPLLFDISTAAVYFLSLFLKANDESGDRELNYYPHVTIVVPVHNSAGTLYKCLKSILNQSYPVHLIQVVCVDNGSSDDSFEVFSRFQQAHRDMCLMWTSLDRAGKSIALNTGIYAGYGSYLINVDADAWLDRDAVMHVVRAFESDGSLAAATASIRVDKELGKSFNFIDLVNYCEVIEYLIAFDVGRRYQNLTNTLFTLSGAFSAFRREIILQSFMYQDRTVSEDTDLTFQVKDAIKKRKGRIGCISRAIAYVEPVESLGRLYSQRVRWQRGEIEVMSLYHRKIPGVFGALLDFTGRILISDHTLAFSRLSWTFLIPFLYFVGYSLSMVLAAMAGLFACYMMLDGCYFLVAYKYVDKDFRKELKKIWWVVFLLPFYRYLSYWFRVGGIIQGMTEEKSWRVENPVAQLAGALKMNGRLAAKLMTFGKRRDRSQDL